MSISGRFWNPGRRMPALAVATVSLALVLAACGGGGNGGNGGVSGFSLKVAVGNKTADAVDVVLDDGEPQPVEGCKGAVISFTLPDTDWMVTINGQTAIDSTQLESNLVDSNLVAEVTVNADGTPEVTRIARGSNIQPPSSYGLCT